MVRMFKWLAPAVAALGLIFAVSTTKAADAPAGAGTVAGTVVDAAGKGVAGASVRIMAGGERGGKNKEAAPKAEKPGKGEAGAKGKGGTPVAEGTTDADGKFSIANVPAGSYAVVAGGKGMGMGKGQVTVKAGETANVTLTLQEKKPKAPK